MWILDIVFLVAGFACLVKGADWFVEGASVLAKRFGIPQIVIGLTIVAMGTSLPEAAVSVSAAIKDTAGIAVGNVLGSNIFNVLLILGLTAVIITVPIQKSTLKVDMPFMMAMTVLLMVLGVTGSELSRIDGAVLWLFFIAYMGYLVWYAKKHPETEDTVEKDWSVLKCIFFLLLGGGMIVLGSNLTVEGATNIATLIGISERVIGLTIVACGTSLPELVTSVVAARKKNADIAIGNIVGSNIFNILFILGTASLITPIPFEQAFLTDAIIALAAAVLLWIGVVRKKALSRSCGIVMLVCYVAYVTWLIVK